MAEKRMIEVDRVVELIDDIRGKLHQLVVKKLCLFGKRTYMTPPRVDYLLEKIIEEINRLAEEEQDRE